MIKARFYDGRSAKALEADVQVLGHSLMVYESESKNQHSFNIELLDITKSTNEVILSQNDIQIHIDLNDFKTLGIKQTFLGKEKKPIMAAMMIAVVMLAIGYFIYKPVLNLVAQSLPDEFFDHQSKLMKELYATRQCLTKSQEEHLKEIFARLGKNYTDYHVYVVSDPLANAFAAPGNVMIINDGLIKKVSSAEALAGVIAHEIAHIEGKHINIMVVKNFAIETIWAFAFSDNALSGMAKGLSQGLFSQGQEQDADQVAADLLKDQHIDPKGTAEFFKMMEKEENGYLKYLVLSHPAYPNRIKTFSAVYDSTPVLSEAAWNELKKGCP